MCDGCFNCVLASFEHTARERQQFEAERAAQAASARNFRSAATPGEAERKRAALLGAAEAKARTSARAKVEAGGGGRAAAAAGSAQEQLERNKELLAQRGEKLSRIEDRAKAMEDSAKGFASAAEKLKRMGGWW